VAAGLLAWAVVRVFGLDSGYPLVPLLAFTPYVALAGLPLAGILFAVGRRLPAVVAAAASVVLIALVAPRAIPDGAPDPPPEGPELRAMSANILYGRADLDDLRNQVLDGEVDVLSVVELTPEATREIRRSEIGAALPHAVIEPRPGAAGTGLFSRFPLERLPAPGRTGFDLPTLIARASLPGGVSADVYSIHPPPPTNSANVATIRRYFEAIPSAADEGPPRLLVGDFNATLDNDSLRDLLDRGYVDAAAAEGAGLTPTWRQSIHPPVTLDHVIVDERVDVLDFDAEPLEGSDHRTASAELRVPAPG
jgi:hypothetical protein